MAQSSVRDLQSILQQTLGKNVIIDSYQVNKNFLQPGENYGSKLVSIDAKIRRDKSSKSEDLSMVAKLPPVIQHQELMDIAAAFDKEIFMYSQISPVYKKLEIDSGISDVEAFNNSPFYYGSRLLKNSDNNQLDDDTVILLENLKNKNYYVVERRVGCDLDHSKVIIKTLARFHALGAAMKHKNTEFFEIVKVKSKFITINNPDVMVDMVMKFLQFIEADAVIGKYYQPLLSMFMSLGSDIKVWFAPPSEPWASIVHSDFWINNYMFKKSNNSSIPVDVKFIDFQNFLFASPMRELIFFLSASTTNDVLNNHHDELVDMYYQTFIERLKLVNCDPTPYTRDSFNKQLRQDMRMEFFHVISMLKIITMDVKADDPDARNIMNLISNTENNNEIYINKLRNFVTFVQEGDYLVDN